MVNIGNRGTCSTIPHRQQNPNWGKYHPVSSLTTIKYMENKKEV